MCSCELPKNVDGGGPAGVEDGIMREGGGPAGVVDGMLVLLARRESGVDGGVDDGTRKTIVGGGWEGWCGAQR